MTSRNDLILSKGHPSAIRKALHPAVFRKIAHQPQMMEGNPVVSGRQPRSSSQATSTPAFPIEGEGVSSLPVRRTQTGPPLGEGEKKGNSYSVKGYPSVQSFSEDCEAKGTWNRTKVWYKKGTNLYWKNLIVWEFSFLLQRRGRNRARRSRCDLCESVFELARRAVSLV